MNWVALSLGSNIKPVENLKSCLDALLLKFNDLSLSSVFESESIGFKGDNFLNMVVAFETDMKFDLVVSSLKKIEDSFGRDRTQPRFSGRTIDIDILVYGESTGVISGVEIPRAEITENAYVLWPLSQVGSQKKHPVLGQSYKALWESYDKKVQNLWPADFEWHGRKISQKNAN